MTNVQEIVINKKGPKRGLYTLCTPVEDFESIRPLLLAMLRKMYLEGLDGLSANQCGEAKQLFVTDVPGDHIRVFINPIVTIVDPEMGEYTEVCASYDRAHTRKRHAHVIVDALNAKGDRFILDTSSCSSDAKGRAVAARVQHQMEHLFGLDVRAEPEAGQTALADLLPVPVRVQQQEALAEGPTSDLLYDYIVSKFL